MSASTIFISGIIVIFSSIQAFAKPMEVVLRLKEKITMAELALTVTDPRSERFQKFYSTEEIRDLAGPSDREEAALKTELAQDGLTIVSESKTHLFITVQADSAILENVFSTHLEDTDSGRGFATRTRMLSPYMIPSRYDLVQSVSGLDTTRRAFTHLLPATMAATTSSPTSPDQIHAAYGFNTIYGGGLSGSGQHIAIATYDDLDLSDVASYYTSIGMKTQPTVDKVIFNGTPSTNPDSAAETETDAELSGMIAPGASIHVFPSAHNDDPGEVQVFTAILDDSRAKVVNYSWGSCEATTSTQHKSDMDTVFARAVAQGVNIMVASGDTGAEGCRDTQVNPDFPGAHPDVVAVGGTTFKVKGSQLSETAWSCSSGQANCSGGGVSTFYDLPAWQSGFQSPYVKRSFPDVAFNADPNTGEKVWIHYPSTTAQWIQIGGTSIAAPQWSGFLALVNQARGTKGPIGFLNPVIYGFSSAQKARAFDDVTQGNNGYPAGPGWDAVTGWGAPHADILLNLLR